MFWKIKYKKTFNYWQNKASVHPLTCNNGCGNLKLEYIDDNNILHLYCPKCGYQQEYLPDIIYNYWLEQMKTRKLKIEPFFRWYDLWIGIYIDTNNDSIYICPIPMFGIKIWWKYKTPFDELVNRN